MNNYRDHLYTPPPYLNDNLNEGAMWDKVKGFVGKHKGKLTAGAAFLGGGYLASKFFKKPPKEDRIDVGTDYEYDPKTGQWYKITHSYVRRR